jgi:membrane protein YqaA with SNARE-associated domain
VAPFIQHLLEQYGYLVLGLALILELLALPLPGEILMTYAGLMVYQGHLNWPLSILTAGLGASAGMTLSYWIGYKLGTPFIEKYGAKFHFGPDKVEKTSRWFERYGNKLLIIAFYIHGVRHFRQSAASSRRAACRSGRFVSRRDQPHLFQHSISERCGCRIRVRRGMGESQYRFAGAVSSHAKRQSCRVTGISYDRFGRCDPGTSTFFKVFISWVAVQYVPTGLFLLC